MGYVLTGRRMTAATALHFGLVNEVVGHADLDRCVAGWTDDLLRSAPLSVQAIKESVLRSLDMPLEQAFKTRCTRGRSAAGTARTPAKAFGRSWRSVTHSGSDTESPAGPERYPILGSWTASHSARAANPAHASAHSRPSWATRPRQCGGMLPMMSSHSFSVIR